MNRKVILVNRPEGLPKAGDFKIIQTELDTNLQKEEVLVQVDFASIDPSQRHWISKNSSEVNLGDNIKAVGCGTVLSSHSSTFKPGDHVSGLLGWQEFAKVHSAELYKLPSYEQPHLYLSVLGLTGLTAYFAVLEIARPQKQDTMLVSNAAGAVGSIACQIGKMKGCRVVGIAGSEEKCRWMTDQVGIDACVNYKKAINLARSIKSACPGGVDIYIDNVGGEMLDSVLLNINKYAKVILCGAISAYNLSLAPRIYYYPLIISMSASLIGFEVWDYRHRFGLATQSLNKWEQEGRLKHREQILKGLHKAPKALQMLLLGQNTGKLIIKIHSKSPKI